MNKKVILIIILAGFLAFLGALALLNICKQNQEPQPLPELEETQLPITEPELKNEPESIEVKTTEEKPPVKQPVKSSAQRVAAPKTVSTAKTNSPKIKPVSAENSVEEPVQNAEIIQEEGSKDIVITKEYKIKSPAKYTFK